MHSIIAFVGGAGRIRTDTEFNPADFKSAAYNQFRHSPIQLFIIFTYEYLR